MFVLLQGKVALIIDGAVVHEIQAPGIIGEAALIAPGATNFYTVRSEGLCQFRMITSTDATEVLESFPGDVARLKKLASRNLESLREAMLSEHHGQNLFEPSKK